MIEVAAAIIEDRHGKLLIARRQKGKSQGGLWEFPGGKLEAGESVEQCLKRELEEEMGIIIEPYEAYGCNIHSYGEIVIRLWAHRARLISGSVQLRDHDAVRWVELKELGEYTFAPADIPFVERLVKGVQEL